MKNLLMRLLLMRHGSAALSTDDFHRPLTEEGVAGVKSNAKMLRSAQDIPTRIVASPLIRAQQTAFIMAEELGLSEKPESLDLICPESDVEAFIEYLAQTSSRAPAEIILFVSHQPFVGIFMHHLTKVEAFMDTADINCLNITSFSKDGGELKWKIGRN